MENEDTKDIKENGELKEEKKEEKNEEIKEEQKEEIKEEQKQENEEENKEKNEDENKEEKNEEKEQINEIVQDEKGLRIVWKNSNVTHYGTPIVLFIEYGHYTKSGTFIEGLNFINPALEPIFKKVANDIWMEVTSY